MAPPNNDPIERLIGVTQGILSDSGIIRAKQDSNHVSIDKHLTEIKVTLTSIATALGAGQNANNPSGKQQTPGQLPVTLSGGGVAPTATTGGSSSAQSAAAAQSSGGKWTDKFSHMFDKIAGTTGGEGIPGVNVTAMKYDAATTMVNTLTGVIKQMAQSVNNRVQTNYEYSLSADKMNVMYQQMYGMSQQRTQDVFRQPLTQYRLGGPGAINDLLAMQASTGIMASGQAQSIASMRALTGYGISAGDAANLTSSLGSAQVANRMFMTTGMSLYGIGGKQNTGMDVIKRLAQASGVLNPGVAAGALQQGSATRMRLQFMGASEEMQNLVIQYGMDNAQFQKRGGKGLYDPGKSADQKLMGISENFSTQKEETDRLKQLRDENMYSRQADNYAALERQTQSLTKMFGYLEDKLSGILGVAVSNRPVASLVGGVASSIGSMSMMAGAVTGNPALFGFGAITSAVSSFIPKILGDGPSGTGDGGATSPTSVGTTTGNGVTVNNNLVVPFGDKGSITLGNLQKRSDFIGLQPRLKNTLLRMFSAANGKVGWNGGKRSTADQDYEFHRRHTVTNLSWDDPEVIEGAKNGLYRLYQGRVWKLNSGANPLAPPGHSYHEIGLAADLAGDMSWINAHVKEFGLTNFPEYGREGAKEAWHVQPSDLPRARDGGQETFPAGASNNTLPYSPLNTSSDSGIVSSLSGLGQKSLTEIIAQYSGARIMSSGGESLSMTSTTGGGPPSSSGPGTVPGTSPVTGSIPKNGSGALYAAQLAYAVGFRGDALRKIVAIAGRESGWDPSKKNPNTSDRGMWQINWAANGKTMMKELGVTGPEGMFDPMMNAKGAWILYQRGGWTPWKASDHSSIPGRWHGKPGWDPKGDEMWHTGPYIAAATAAAHQVDKSYTGDPGPLSHANTATRTMGHVTNNVSGGTTVNIAPVIHMAASGNMTGDLQEIARQVGNLLRREVELSGMRGS